MIEVIVAVAGLLLLIAAGSASPRPAAVPVRVPRRKR